MTITENVRKKLADYAHMTWSGWMQYMFEKSTKNEDGTVTIPVALVERWTRQMNTPYPMLPESERKSDIDEANRILGLTGAWAELYPRAWKLMDERKIFVVVAFHEPYFRMVYEMIREEENRKGTWTEQDEHNYQVISSTR